MEGGFITLAGLLVLAPFLMWAERAQKFRQLSPVEQNLQRASHGFALAVFVLLATFGMYGWRAVLGVFPRLAADPAGAWPAVLFFGGLFAYGFARFLAGVRRSAGTRDGLLAFRALLKLAIGLAGSWFFWRAATVPARSISANAALLGFVLLVISLWCALTGAVRFVLTLGLRRKPKAPTLHPSPRGAARDASQAEAAAAMQRSGARKISLDDRRF
jgi:hypothetical protein